jgi:hypothetical protein
MFSIQHVDTALLPCRTGCVKTEAEEAGRTKEGLVIIGIGSFMCIVSTKLNRKNWVPTEEKKMKRINLFKDIHNIL